MTHGCVDPSPFSPVARWIWDVEDRQNHYALFCRDLEVDASLRAVSVTISASYHYELFLDGGFVARGPVHGDPAWCHYDVLEHVLDEPPANAGPRGLHVAIVVHHSHGTYLHYLTPAPGGLIAEIHAGGEIVGTDSRWRCLTLPMWRDDVPAKGWALGYCEDYDATLEPEGWREKVFRPELTATWEAAREVDGADTIWGGWQRREIPLFRRCFVEPRSVQAWVAPGPGTENVFDISRLHDEETLRPAGALERLGARGLHDSPQEANAFTLDLGAEHVGFATIDLEAPAGTVVEISGAELLRGERPWVFRKGTCYSMRYRCRSGRQRFLSFCWSGFRYLHVVLRGTPSGVRLYRIGCTERKAPLTLSRRPSLGDAQLERVFELCRRTLEVGVQEIPIDCPTREQAAAWADSLWIAWSLWRGYDEPGWMRWYLEAFLRAPFDKNGLTCGRYPGTKGIWLDFCLMPLFGQRFHRERTGAYYRPLETVRKALRLKQWYDRHTDGRGPTEGLVNFDFHAFYERGLRNFVDHPGLGMHDSPHRGIDRDGCSCALNCFFLGFVEVLGEMAGGIGRRSEAEALAGQAGELRRRIRTLFFDGELYHDAWKQGKLSEGTSWQTNALAVWTGLSTGAEARALLELMLSGYDRLCRCTPYFHVFFLPALRMSGLEAQARELIKREWGVMLEGGATTAWEGFGGDAKDSLCHPFSTAPLLFLLDS